MDEIIVLSDDSNDSEAFYPDANYGDGREEQEEEEFLNSEGEAEGSSTGLNDDDFQDPGDSHFAGLRGGLWSPRPGEWQRCYQPTSSQPASYRLDDDPLALDTAHRTVIPKDDGQGNRTTPSCDNPPRRRVRHNHYYYRYNSFKRNTVEYNKY